MALTYCATGQEVSGPRGVVTRCSTYLCDKEWVNVILLQRGDGALTKSVGTSVCSPEETHDVRRVHTIEDQRRKHGSNMSRRYCVLSLPLGIFVGNPQKVVVTAFDDHSSKVRDEGGDG